MKNQNPLIVDLAAFANFAIYSLRPCHLDVVRAYRIYLDFSYIGLVDFFDFF